MVLRLPGRDGCGSDGGNRRDIENIPTPRLFLRRFVLADIGEYLAFTAHPEVTRFMDKPPMDEAKAALYLAAQSTLADDERGKWHGYAIVHRESKRVIGEVGMFLQTEPDDEGDLGFALHPDFQGRGYATEAAQTLIRHGFETLGLRRITAGCDARNESSYRLMERLGMRRVATSEKALAYALDRTDESNDAVGV